MSSRPLAAAKARSRESRSRVQGGGVASLGVGNAARWAFRALVNCCKTSRIRRPLGTAHLRKPNACKAGSSGTFGKAPRRRTLHSTACGLFSETLSTNALAGCPAILHLFPRRRTPRDSEAGLYTAQNPDWPILLTVCKPLLHYNRGGTELNSEPFTCTLMSEPAQWIRAA